MKPKWDWEGDAIFMSGALSAFPAILLFFPSAILTLWALFKHGLAAIPGILQEFGLALVVGGVLLAILIGLFKKRQWVCSLIRVAGAGLLGHAVLQIGSFPVEMEPSIKGSELGAFVWLLSWTIPFFEAALGGFWIWCFGRPTVRRRLGQC